MNGAAHGKGIYLSPLSSVSFGYTRGYYGKVITDRQVRCSTQQRHVTIAEYSVKVLSEKLISFAWLYVKVSWCALVRLVNSRVTFQ